MSFNFRKTDIIIFLPENKQITKRINFKISGQKVHTNRIAKYLVVTLEENID